MINFTNYIPVYVRADGNDITGNGSLGLPFATAQRAFEYAYNQLGVNQGYSYSQPIKYILDFGVGNFGNINIKNNISTSVSVGSMEYAVVAPNALSVNGISVPEPVGFGFFSINSNNNIKLFHIITSTAADPENNAIIYLTFSPALPENFTIVPMNNNIYNTEIWGTSSVTEWSDSIAVRGAGSELSFINNIIADGTEGICDWNSSCISWLSPPTPGKNLTIYSDLSINIGNISSNGPYYITAYTSGHANGGNIILKYCVAENVDANGGNGGNITIINSQIQNISSNGLLSSSVDHAGNIILTNSFSNNIFANTLPAFGGNITLQGSILLYNSRAHNIQCKGIPHPYSVDGGYVLLNSSTASSVDVSSGTGSYSDKGNGGTIKLSGYTILPPLLIGNVDNTDLFQGTCPNGASL